jgi:hypothetical protein
MPEAAVKCLIHQVLVSVETIGARSLIFVSLPVTLLPPGFDEVDIAILHWLAGEAQRARRSLQRQQ